MATNFGADVPGMEDNGEVFKISVGEDDEACSGAASTPQANTRVYKRRWIVLALFIALSTSSALQWIQYSIIANIIMKYYDVSSFSVDWMSMVYMITYIPLIFPASWLLDKMPMSLLVQVPVTFAIIVPFCKCWPGARRSFSMSSRGQLNPK